MVQLQKLKSLVDVRNLKLTRETATESLPKVFVERIELAIIRSPLSNPLANQSEEEVVKVRDMLLHQIRQLGLTQIPR